MRHSVDAVNRRTWVWLFEEPVCLPAGCPILHCDALREMELLVMVQPAPVGALEPKPFEDDPGDNLARPNRMIERVRLLVVEVPRYPGMDDGVALDDDRPKPPFREIVRHDPARGDERQDLLAEWPPVQFRQFARHSLRHITRREQVAHLACDAAEGVRPHEQIDLVEATAIKDIL